MMQGEALIVSDEELKNRFTTLQNDFELKRKEWNANEQRYNSQLNFSKEANQNLKNDYDLLQDKFENYMRTNNTINGQLKEEVEEQRKRKELLQFQFDDLKEDSRIQVQDTISQCRKKESEI